MDSATIFARVKNILLSPKTEWPVGAHFIKSILIGIHFLGITVHVSIGAGIGRMVLSYIRPLVLVYVMAWIVNALAGTFGGQANLVQALKVVAYSWTAAWIAGIAVIIPWLGILIMIAGGIYSIYLLYLGLPHTMKCPPEKAAGYTAVSVIIAIVLGWVISLIVGLIFVGAMGGAALSGVNVSSSNGDRVTLDNRD